MKKYLPIITLTALTAILVSVITKMLGGESESNLPLFVSVTILPILYFIIQNFNVEIHLSTLNVNSFNPNISLNKINF